MEFKREHIIINSDTHSHTFEILKHAYNALLQIHQDFSTYCPTPIPVPLP